MLSADDAVRSTRLEAAAVGERPRPGPAVRLISGLLGSVVSGVLLLFGTGLHPVWWLAWLAPIPVLALAPRVGARRAAWMATLTGLVGMAGYVRYLVDDLQSPPIVALSYAAAATVVVAVTVLLFRTLVLRGFLAVAALAAPAAWASGEYLLATLTTAGTNWTLANSQADALPVLQVVSFVGPWGVGFVVLATAATVAALTAPGASARGRVGVAAVGVTALAVTIVPGLVLLSTSPATSSLSTSSPAASPSTVSVVAVPRPDGQPRADTPAGQTVVDADLAWLAGSPARGGLVVFPEKDLVTDDESMPSLSGRFAAAATARSTTVVLGVEHHSGPSVRNEALVFVPDQEQPLVYDKRHPVPGVEDEITPGDRMATVPASDPRVGVAICADLGQVSLGREYGRAGTGVLAVPALDFVVDAWSQSRVQLMRGVENGYVVARSSRQGLLTISDARGRVLAQAPVDDKHTRAISATMASTPGETLYARRGDWFAWLCLTMTALAVALAVRIVVRRSPPVPLLS